MLGATAEDERRVDGRAHVDVLLAAVADGGALVADVHLSLALLSRETDLSEDVLAVVDEDGGRDVALVVVHVHRLVGLRLLAEDNRLLRDERQEGRRALKGTQE